MTQDLQTMGQQKQEFPLLSRKIHDKPLVYLDNAATTQKPRVVLDAIRDFYGQHNANVHRGIHQLSQEASQLYEDAHKTAARFLNAGSMEEIAFTRNTTESLNLLAYSLLRDLKKGDEIVLTEMEHHSNLVPWQQLAKRQGLKTHYLPVKDDGHLDYDQAAKIITKKTRILSFAHVSNSLGTVNDAKTLIKLAHENDAFAVMDAAQSVPHFPLDVKMLDADFLAFSGHKMFGPMGIGALFGKKEHLQDMQPFLYGGGMIREVTLEDTSFTGLPWKFEAGTPNVADAVGLKAAIDYLGRIGMKDVDRHERKLIKYAAKRLSEVEGITLHGPDDRTALVSFNYKEVHPHDVGSLLDTEGIAVRTGHHCCMPLMKRLGIPGTVRASFAHYNTEEDVDSLMAGIDKVKKVFS